MHLTFLSSALISLAVVKHTNAETCRNPTIMCLNTNCLSPEVCINIGTADETCCLPADVLPDSPTPSTPCVDLLNPRTGTSDCPNMASYCNNQAYYTLMTEQCPKTCGRCSGVTTPSPPPCVDLLNPKTGKSDCPGMASYCNNQAYFTLMTQQCPKTCGRCPSG